jgi:hypothetical protein
MHDEASRQVEAGRDHGVARVAMTDRGTCGVEAGSGRREDGAADSAPAGQPLVGRVDDGVDRELRDVALERLESHRLTRTARFVGFIPKAGFWRKSAPAPCALSADRAMMTTL